jgi:DNA-binding NtrC family response regulator
VRIVLAEDDEDIRFVMHQVLTQSGDDVEELENGVQLAQRLAIRTPAIDVIITDICMPWMNGVQVLKIARSAGITTPVLVITGVTDRAVLHQTESLGNIRVLLKPVDIKTLRTSIAELIAGVDPPS